MPLFGRRQVKRAAFGKNESMDEDMLLSNRAPPPAPVHPRWWMLLGATYAALGLTLIIMAGSWLWILGCLFGVTILKMGTTLVGIGLSGGHPAPLPPGATFWQRCKHAAGSFVMWGSAKFQQLFWFFRWPVYGLGMFALLLIAIHASSPDPRITAFPAACPRHKHLGCSRVAEKAAHAARGLQPLHLPAALNDTQAAVAAWVEGQVGARVLLAAPGFLHARFVTPVFGFGDDFMVGLSCGVDGSTVVEAQGQLRLGQSDLGVNARRNQRFFAAVAAATVPPGTCAPS